jgi:hypothetical protein
MYYSTDLQNAVYRLTNTAPGSEKEAAAVAHLRAMWTKDADKRTTPEQVADNLTDLLNPMGLDLLAVARALGREHRTLQQTFTSLCRLWLGVLARDESGHDGRNQAAYEFAVEVDKHVPLDFRFPII